MDRKVSPICATVCLILMTQMQAFANSNRSNTLPNEETGTGRVDKSWSVMVGVGQMYSSKYVGSRSSDSSIEPILEATYKRWLINLDGVRYSVLNDEKRVLGLGVRYAQGRNEDDYPARFRGIGDVDDGVYAVIFSEFVLFNLFGLAVDVEHSSGDSNSTLVNALVGTEYPVLNEQAIIGIGVGANWANSDHMQAHYGVNPTQSSRSSLEEFYPGSGIEKVVLSGVIDYFFGKNWTMSLTGGIEYLSLNKSPLIEDSSQPFLHMGLSYTW